MNASIQLDQSTRGIPAGVTVSDDAVSGHGWFPGDGGMALPVLTMDMGAFTANTDAFFDFADGHDALLAPHAKTPMIPELALSLVKRGAWGATVANPQQLNVILETGIRNVIVASPPGGAAGATQLARTTERFPGAEVHVFLDSVEGVTALNAALTKTSGSNVHGLVEVGFGRTGARTIERSKAVLDAILATGGAIRLSGVATYEAAAVTGAEPAEVTLARLFDLVTETYEAILTKVTGDERIILTAGGSVYFDTVVQALNPLASRRANTSLILRSGAIFFSDDGLYQRAFSAMAQRGLATQVAHAVRPVLSLWAEVLSRPEDGLAIAGFGMRDAPNDQGLPVVRRVFRDGTALDADVASGVRVDRLNDQHAFLTGPLVDRLQVGDILELGISHPCTALQRWRVIFGVGKSGKVDRVYRTRFD